MAVGELCLGLFVLVLIILLLLAIFLPFSSCSPTESCSCKKEPFTNVYRYWSKKLRELKESDQLGLPNGVLEFNPSESNCDSQGNLLPQPNVAFKPTRRFNGCTYLDLRYPG